MHGGQSNILGILIQRLRGIRSGSFVIDESNRHGRHLILGESARCVRVKGLNTPKRLHSG